MLPEGPERDRLVYEQPQLVLSLERNHGLEVADRTGIHVDTLDDEEAALDHRQLGILFVLGCLLIQKLFKMGDVVVAKILDLAPGSIQAFLDGEIDTLVSKKQKLFDLYVTFIST